MTPSKLKFGEVHDGLSVAWSAEPRFARQVTGGVERLVIAPGVGHIALVRDLLDFLPEPFWVLYVLGVPRGSGSESAAGRYRSAQQHARAEVLALLDRFENFFSGDGRHNLWIAAPPAGQLVYDRHELIYAYGPIAEISSQLKTGGIAETEMIRVPDPHSHHYHEEFDADERAILTRWVWTHSQLQEQDGF